MSEQPIIVDVSGPVMTVTLNRPKVLNAFSEGMINGLTRALQEAQKNNQIRAIIITGAGQSFSAGGDVKAMGEATPAQVYEHIGILNECILTLKQTEKPIIAAVHGYAAGAGVNLALACDLIISTNDSQYALSFSQVGLVSDGGGSFFLTKLLGPHLAKQLFFSGEVISAERLFGLGVINQLVTTENLLDEAMEWAIKLSKGPSLAFGKQKKLIEQSLTASLDEVLEHERMTQTLMVTTKDHIEGVKAFKEKRSPQFLGY
ncbi:enoyl-CoA hydratase-related protein [Bacillus spongiae]|uniref:Enoyl-CoA hydratase-related protein n=1 Tax=Bacillus spongiae TaxID=2683610 RepID=A0ABU8HCL8_9BACI